MANPFYWIFGKFIAKNFCLIRIFNLSSFEAKLRCNVNNRFNLDIRRFAKCLLREFHRQKYKFPLRVFDR